MAVVHPGSELTPTKDELLAAWVPTQPWWPAGAPALPAVATFRFDDPAGAVGIETFLLPVGDQVLQVPLTYRDAPLQQGTLVGEMEHSALGRRWIYDGPSDPVYVAEATAVITEGRGEVELVDGEGQLIPRRASTASVNGSGGGDDGGTGELTVARLVPGEVPAAASATLTGTWQGRDEPVVLAWLS